MCQNHLSPARSNFMASQPYFEIFILDSPRYTKHMWKKKKQKKNPHKLGGEQVSKVLGNLCNIFVAEKLVPLTAFVRPDDKQTSSLPEGCTAQLHKQFPLLGVQSPARSLFPPVLTAAFILQRNFQQIGFLPPAAQRFVSPLKELRNLHQIISLQVSSPWKQIGPKGRHIVIMRERLRGGEKRSQHEAQEVLWWMI